MNTSGTAPFDATQLALQTPVRVVFTTVLVVITFKVTVGNLCSLIVLFKIKILSETAQISMISMAFANLGIGLFAALPGTISAAMGKWPFGDALCTLQAMLFQVMLFASSGSLFMMSLDRYIAIAQPLRYHQIVSRSKGITGAVVCWCIACTGGFLLGPFQPHWNKAVYTPYECCCKFTFANPVCGVIWTILAFLPAFLNTYLYTRIGVIAKAHAKKIQVTIPDKPPAKCMSAPTTDILVGYAFDICVFPFMVFNICDFAIHDKTRIMFYVGFICRALFYAYSFVCLTIYYKRNKAFKKELLQLTDKLAKGSCGKYCHDEEHEEE